MNLRTMTSYAGVLALIWTIVGCGGGGGGSAAIPSGPHTTTPLVTPTPSAAPTSAAGWRLTVYYTPVASYYSGAPQTVTGCSDLQCTNRNVTLGTFPSDFVQTVQTEGTGKIGANRYLNWSIDVGYWLDTLPRDAQGNPLLPYRSAAADPSIPFGSTFKIATCGADTATGTPTSASACSTYQWPTWQVTDRFSVGSVGAHVDLYIGEQTSANFAAGPTIIDASGATIAFSSPVANAPAWKPSTTDSFQWILGAALDLSANASVYDVDAFETSAASVASLHAMNRHAVCYINVGAYENWRPDAASFPTQTIGAAYSGWPGESWLDIRRIDLLGPIMQARLDMCAAKGFDAVEPDNIEGFENATGFPLSAADQIVYNTWLAALVHDRHMAIALKNDATQAAQLLGVYDFALTEDCWNQGWCAQLAPFHAAGKAVITVEYTDLTSAASFTSTVCPQARSAGFDAILKHRNLDAWIQTCP